MHNFHVMAGSLVTGVLEHLSMWEGWAVLIAAALLAWRGAAWWVPVVVALVINPEPYGAVAGLVHGRHVSLYAAALFTLCQLVLGYVAFFAGRLASGGLPRPGWGRGARSSRRG